MYTDLKNKVESLIDASKYDKAVKLAQKELKIGFKILSHTFKSHSFDKDGQKRNVFKIQLSKNNEEYVFEFGQSTAKSCKESNEWEQLKDNDLIEVYAGCSIPNKSIYGSVKFKVSKLQLQNLDDVELLKYATQIKDSVNEDVEDYNKKCRTKFDHLNYFGDVQKAVSYVKIAVERKIEELKDNSVMSNEPLEQVIEPTLYSVLTCLQKYDVGTFEDFCGEFGYDTDSRTAEKTYKAVVKEFQAMQRLFSEDELEVLQMIQ